MKTKLFAASPPLYGASPPPKDSAMPPAPTGALAASVTCREAIRLLRRMLMRLLWPQLPFAERTRLAREARRLMSDLMLALLILEDGTRVKRSTALSPSPKSPRQSRPLS